MSFVSMAHELAALKPAPRFSAAEMLQVDVGRLVALEVADEVRRGTREPDLLMHAAELIGKSGEHALRGYFRTLQQALA